MLQYYTLKYKWRLLDEKTIDMGNGIIGTCTDPKCPIYLDNQGILGGAYSFEGDDFISIPDEDSLTRQIFSISVWVKPSELSEYDEIISKYNEFLIRRNGTYIHFFLYEAAKPTAKWEPRVRGISLIDTVNSSNSLNNSGGIVRNVVIYHNSRSMKIESFAQCICSY